MFNNITYYNTGYVDLTDRFKCRCCW